MYNMGCLLWHIYVPKKAVCLQVHQAGFINVLIYGEEFIEYWTNF
jgi:hypothetical protein